ARPMGAAPEIAWKTGADGRHHSGLIWAARMTLAHFSVSSARSLPNAAGVSASAVPPKIGKARLDFGISEGHRDLAVELIDNRGGRVPGRATPEPVARLEARHKFAHGRDVRQRLRPRCGRHRERAQLPAPNVLDRSGDPSERDHDLSAEQIGQCRPRTAIGHVNKIDAGYHLE